MALSNFQYSKSWRNAEDFPTFEENEEQVRDDMQLLFDEARDALNRLVGELKAANIPFRPTDGVNASTVQNAIEVVQEQLSETVLGQLPDGSVTTEKLAAQAVTAAKLAALAVTTAKLANEAVTAAKLAAGAVTQEKLAAGAVTAEKLAAGAVTAEKLAAGVLDGKADLVGGKVLPAQLSRKKSFLSVSRAFDLGDEGRAIYCINSSAITLTIPSNAEAAFPTGTEITVFRRGGGKVLFEASPEVTLLCPGATAISSRFSSVRLKKWDTNIWSLEGEGLAPAGYQNNFSEGFAPAGPIRLSQGVHIFDSLSQLPEPGVAGRIFLVKNE